MTRVEDLLRRRRMLAIAVAAVVLVGCGGGGDSVSLAKLAANQDAYVGKRVTTTRAGRLIRIERIAATG